MPARRKKPVRIARALIGLLIALTTACSSCGSEDKKPGATAPAELAPVPEPAGLVGDVFVQKPGDLWTKLRSLGGGPLRLMPAGFGMLTTTLLGLTPTNAESLDDDIPLTAAIAEDGDDLVVVVAAHVKSGPELVARLSTGADAPYVAKPDAPSGVTLLEPKSGKGEVAIGVTGNHLLAGKNADFIKKLGPYAARTLSKREAPKAPVLVTLKKQALTGPVTKKIRAWWKAQRAKLEQADRDNRQKHGSRSPDFGDPRAAIGGLGSAIDSLVALLGSASGARIVVEPSTERLQARLELDAEKHGRLAEFLTNMTTGDAEPLLALPSDVSAAVLTRSSEKSGLIQRRALSPASWICSGIDWEMRTRRASARPSTIWRAGAAIGRRTGFC